MFVGLFLIALSFLLLGNLGRHLSTIAVTLPLFIISVANGLAWQAVAKTVLSDAPQDQAGSASGMFYTIYNVGRVLSQTLVLLIMESRVATPNAFVEMTDTGFRIFTIFFLIALMMVFFMLQAKKFEQKQNH